MAEQIEKQLGLLEDLDKPEETPEEKPLVEAKGKSIFDDVEDPDCQYCGDAEGGCAQCGFGRNKK